LSTINADDGFVQEQYSRADERYVSGKATMRRMAQLGMPDKTMQSVSGHSKDVEVRSLT